MDHQAFIDGEKNYLIAPAGYGKTHTIAQCIKLAKGKQLVLTHTHAGVASIKEKLDKEGIPPQNHNVTTITGFAQRYALAFYTGSDLPDQDNKTYFPFVVNEAAHILQNSLVQEVIKKSYTGLFVDEYQDCTESQHKLIMTLAEALPTHILGDPLQGIYGFNENDPLIDMEPTLDGNSFRAFPKLVQPQRWLRDGNAALGEHIKDLRDKLENKEEISLEHNDNHFNCCHVNDNSLYQLDRRCCEKLKNLIKNPENKADYKSLLILLPEYKDNSGWHGNIKDRIQVIKQTDFTGQLNLLDAIDSNFLYSQAKEVDKLLESIPTARKPIKKIRAFIERLFLKSGKNGTFNWFSTADTDDTFKNKRQQQDKANSLSFQCKVKDFRKQPTYYNCYQLMVSAQKDLTLDLKRTDIFKTLMKILKESCISNNLAFEEMKAYKNRLRRSGRKITGKCIGSTLLTKGLEFDTVVILNAEKFQDPKNFYVAISRCRKRLIIFSSTRTLRLS